MTIRQRSRRAMSIGRMVGLYVVVGAVAGLGSITFYWALEFCKHWFLYQLAGHHNPGPAGELELFEKQGVAAVRWLLIVVPAAGGLLSGVLVYWLAPEAAGHGTDAAIDAYHHHGGRVRARVPFVKAITAAITIGSGGSGGREGPIAQIGSGFGSWIGGYLKLSNSERRTLMAAGMGAGVGAIFHAPLAGALFASEVLYAEMDIEHEVLVPAFISSIVAYSVFAVRFGWSPVFETPPMTFDNPRQLAGYALLGVVVAVGAMIYVRVFYGIHHLFERLTIPRFAKPMVGGLFVGVVGYFWPTTLGSSYSVLQEALRDPREWGIAALLGFAGVKIMTTAFSIGSGGSGGVFGPAVVIGGSLGGAVGLGINALLPGLGIDASAFVLVGMAGFFAAAANCPISTLIMVSEMTGNYHLLVPSMLVCVLSYLCCRRWALYESQLGSRLEAPAKLGSMLRAVLRGIRVDQALEIAGGPESLATFDEDTPLDAIIRSFTESDQESFPVLSNSGELVGVVYADEIRHAICEESLGGLVVARDLALPVVAVSSADTFYDAVVAMSESRFDHLLVVSAEDPQSVLAVLDHRKVLDAYSHTLMRGRQDQEGAPSA